MLLQPHFYKQPANRYLSWPEGCRKDELLPAVPSLAGVNLEQGLRAAKALALVADDVAVSVLAANLVWK